MTYTPDNLEAFIAVYSGALAGMGVSDRVPSNPNASHYSGLAAVAGAYAQEFDTLWGVQATTDLDIQLMTTVSEALWQSRSPVASGLFLVPATYATDCNALIAMLHASNTYFVAQGVSPDLPASGGAIVFDGPAALTDPQNIRSDLRVEQAEIDNTKENIVCISTDDGAVPGRGARATGATILGGKNNKITALSVWSLILGGLDNEIATAIAEGYATILGGEGNIAHGFVSTILGGYFNRTGVVGVSGYCSVAGGYHSDAFGDNSLAIGSFCVASGLGSIAFGSGNVASGALAAVLGGSSCDATGPGGVVAGGEDNHASGFDSFVGGGVSNTASGDNSYIPGGDGNTASGVNSFAGGNDSLANGTSSTAVGNTCTALGHHSQAFGWESASNGDSGMATGYKAYAFRDGQRAHSSSTTVAGAAGSNQTSTMTMRGTTPGVGAGEAVVLKYGIEGADSNFILEEDKAYNIRVTLAVGGAVGGVKSSCSFERSCAIFRTGGAATVSAQSAQVDWGSAALNDSTLELTATGTALVATFTTGASVVKCDIAATLEITEVSYT